MKASEFLNLECKLKNNANSSETNKFQNLKQNFHQQYDIKSNIDIVTSISWDSFPIFSLLLLFLIAYNEGGVLIKCGIGDP